MLVSHPHTHTYPHEHSHTYTNIHNIYVGKFSVAQELFMEALQIFIQVYGPMHADIANCYE